MSGGPLTQSRSRGQKEQITPPAPVLEAHLHSEMAQVLWLYNSDSNPTSRRPQNRREPPTAVPCPHATAEAWAFQRRGTWLLWLMMVSHGGMITKSESLLSSLLMPAPALLLQKTTEETEGRVPTLAVTAGNWGREKQHVSPNIFLTWGNGPEWSIGKFLPVCIKF